MPGNTQPLGQREAGIIQKPREPLAFEKDRDFRILSLDGGGIKGLYTSAFLARLEEGLPKGTSIQEYFDLIAGTSTGGIIAIGLSAGLSAREIHAIYENHGGRIFSPQSCGILKPKYDAQILASVLDGVLRNKQLRDANVRLNIPSANFRTGENVIFKTPHHPDFKKDASESMLTVALSTSAAPSMFKAHDHRNDKLLDGALITNNPIMIALVDALTCFDINRRQVKILSISPGSPVPQMTIKKTLGGKLYWAEAFKHFIFHGDKNADGQAGLLIGRDRLWRFEPNERNRDIAMDDYLSSLRSLVERGRVDAEAYASELMTNFLYAPAEKAKFFS